jgi:ectoine hydroxylase-related dioxygenase (phytanoyl-CoA dioxygenase family)
VKLPDRNGRLRVHQDPTLVDEERFTPVNVWCPLQDIDDRNGALCILPGSHRLYRGPRATSIPPPWSPHEALIERSMTPLYLTAGSAVLFTQATLHASRPNCPRRRGSPRRCSCVMSRHRSDRASAARNAGSESISTPERRLHVQNVPVFGQLDWRAADRPASGLDCVRRVPVARMRSSGWRARNRGGDQYDRRQRHQGTTAKNRSNPSSTGTRMPSTPAANPPIASATNRFNNRD